MDRERVKLPYPTALTVTIYRDFAMSEKAMNIATALLDHGAGMEEHYRDGDTPLLVAVWQRNLALIDLLLKRGANVNARNEFGATPLMFAAAHGTVGSGDVPLIKKLVQLGADTDAQDTYGSTARMYAVNSDQVQSAAALIRLKANVNIHDNAGKTPLAAARTNGYSGEMVALLKKAGGVP
jgi:ankyrin repeat protein